MSRTSYANTMTKKAFRLYEAYPEVKKWYDELFALRSPRTAINYIECLAGFVEDTGKPPSELAKLNSDDACELMKGWAIKKRNSISDSRIGVIWFAVKNFLKTHKIRVHEELPFSQIQTKYSDKIPTKNELRQIMDATSSLSTKIAMQLMAYGGLRNEDAVDLTYGSIETDSERARLIQRFRPDQEDYEGCFQTVPRLGQIF